MVKLIIAEEVSSGSSPLMSALKRSREIAQVEIRRMLGSMRPYVLQACILGKLSSMAECKKSAIRTEMVRMWDRGDDVPGTYANFFTDKAGTALSPFQL